MNNLAENINQHVAELKACKMCPEMAGCVVTGRPVASKVYFVGQAPGPHEADFGKPFAWTAGKTLFKWIGSIGIDEESFRRKIYMAAVCRCFPGKGKSGGDRVPSKEEIKNCSKWMDTEFQLLQPELVIPVGKLAIEVLFPGAQLNDVVGKTLTYKRANMTCEVICLPHPSGASTWFKREPGQTLLLHALELLKNHPVWQKTFAG